ncbi:MAG: sugar ABC transporter ATP-binding protein [Saprospiraceae bacterium]|nr:sugar ABC transporter ATP-binding protein [Saprospiraceae bacterium]
MKGIHKYFPGVHALKSVDLQLRTGEVLALIGENGAGKSTLIKMLGGAHKPSEGTIEVFGQELQIANPQEARRLGIGVIYQEFNLVPYLSARENIFLGQEIKKGVFIDKGEERRRSIELFRKLGVQIEPERLCQDLSIAEQQIVEIAKALSLDVKILVMDEPSATLTPQEVQGLFSIIGELKEQGISIIYISHRLDEIFEICDRVYVLRDGSYVGSKPIGDITRREMIEMMVGRTVENEFPKDYQQIGRERLKIVNLRREGQKEGVSFSVKAGEVLGITGLIGAGRTELVRLIFGADKRAGGSVWKDGIELNIQSPKDAIKNGIGLLPEDRKGQGLVLMHSVKDNFGLPNLDRFSRYSVILQQQERFSFLNRVKSIRLKISGNDQLAGNLSGGNQQKLVLIKWLERNSDVLIFDEPTRGIDVGAKYEIYLLMNELASKGKAIIMISSELPEVIGMSDRILVMRNGEITGEITDPKSTSQESVMELAVH